MSRSILSIRIEKLRKEKNLNQIELAEKLGLSSSASISQYESGDRVPSDDIKIKMADFFNCSMDYLMGLSNEKNLSSINENDLDLAFYEGYKDIAEEDKEILRATLKAVQQRKMNNSKK